MPSSRLSEGFDFYGYRLREASDIPIQTLAARLHDDIEKGMETSSIAELMILVEFLMVKATIFCNRVAEETVGPLMKGTANRLLKELNRGFGSSYTDLGARIDKVLSDVDDLCVMFLDRLYRPN